MGVSGIHTHDLIMYTFYHGFNIKHNIYSKSVDNYTSLDTKKHFL